MLILSFLILFVFDDFFEKYDLEIVPMIAGFFFGIGFSGLYGVFIYRKGEKEPAK